MAWIILGILSTLGLAVVSAGLLVMAGALDKANGNNKRQ